MWPLDSEVEGYLKIIDIDNDYHFWTIQDAKDGDVLYGSFSTLSKFHVVIDEEYSKDAFYGVQVLRKKHIEVVGNPDYPIDESLYGKEEYDNIYEYPVMTELSSVKHEIIIDHDGGELYDFTLIENGLVSFRKEMTVHKGSGEDITESTAPVLFTYKRYKYWR